MFGQGPLLNDKRETSTFWTFRAQQTGPTDSGKSKSQSQLIPALGQIHLSFTFYRNFSSISPSYRNNTRTTREFVYSSSIVGGRVDR